MDPPQTRRSAPAIWRTANGYDVARIRFRAGEGSVRAIAVAGYEGMPIPRVVVQLAIEAIEDRATPQSERLPALCVALAAGIDPRKVKWPRSDGGSLVTDARRNRQTVVGFGRDYREDVLGLLPGDPGVYARLRHELDPLRQPRVSDKELADVAAQAKWGVHPDEYRSPTEPAVSAVVSRVFELEGQILEDPTATLISELSELSQNDDMEKLAVWWNLVQDGARAVAEGVAHFQRIGVSEAVEEPGGQEARANGVHALLYNAHSEFAYGPWTWRVEGHEAHLSPPYLFSIAYSLLPSDWWDRVSALVLQGDFTPFSDPQGDYVALLHSIARFRLLGGSLPEDGFVDPLAREPLFFTDEELPDVAARPELSGLYESIRTALAHDPRLWEVLRRTEWEGELGRDVALDLGMTPARLSQLRKLAMEQLEESPHLLRLWHTLLER